MHGWERPRGPDYSSGLEYYHARPASPIPSGAVPTQTARSSGTLKPEPTCAEHCGDGQLNPSRPPDSQTSLGKQAYKDSITPQLLLLCVSKPWLIPILDPSFHARSVKVTSVLDCQGWFRCGAMAGDAKSVVPGKICMSTTSNRGANDDDLNLITLCAGCHEALHRSC
jgi:hypothetical protein